MVLDKIDMSKLEEMPQADRIEFISQHLFSKASKDIKYLYCTNFIHFQLLDEEIARTGLYQWLNVFRGDVKFPRDVPDYSVYDIVQVNMSGQDIHLVQNIREQLGENSKTLLVVNNDYTTEMWGPSFDSPYVMAREVNGADMLFGTEYYQTTALSELVGRKCYVIPHPADVKRLKTIPQIPKKDIISTIWRRYDNHWYIPHLCVRNQGLTTQLIGYDSKVNPKSHVCTPLYDYVLGGANYFDFCDQMRESKIVFNPFTFHSYDRSVVDCAALGVAVVGSNRTQSMSVCYPFTCVDPYDVDKSRQLINQLNTDKEFYDKVVAYALEASEFYNHTNCRERYLVALYDAVSSNQREEIKGRVSVKRGTVVESNRDDIFKHKLRENMINDKKNK